MTGCTRPVARWSFAASVIGAALAALGLHAQTPPTPLLPTFHAGTDVVELDVSVLDKDRNPVHGLTAADFTILEDGHPQSIAAFRAIDILDPVIPKTPWVRDVAPDVATNRPFNGRLVVVLFNDRIARTDYWTAQTFTSERALLRAVFTNIRNKMPVALGRGPGPDCHGPGAVESVELLRIADSLAGAADIRKAILFVSPWFPVFPTQDPCVNDEITDFLRKAQQSNISVYPVDPGVFMHAGCRVGEHVGGARHGTRE